MLENCLFVGKKVSEQVLIIFVRRMAYGKYLNLLVIVAFLCPQMVYNLRAIRLSNALSPNSLE